MIYLFTGDDINKKHLAFEKFIKSLPKSTEKFFINRNDFNPMQIESFYSGAGLFFQKSSIIFSDILEREETREFILKNLSHMQDSNNLFIFKDRKLNKPVTDAFKKAKAEINIFELPKEKKERFNNFLLTYDFEKKDKLNLWVHYRQAVDLGVGLEELVGVLFWKAKDMVLKNNFNKFTKEQLQSFIMTLPYLLPEARSKGKDAEIVFERFLLSSF